MVVKIMMTLQWVTQSLQWTWAAQTGKNWFQRSNLQSSHGVKESWTSRSGEQPGKSWLVSSRWVSAVPTLIFATADATYRWSTWVRAAIVIRLPGLNSDCTLTALWPSKLFNLAVFSFIICKMGTAIAPTLEKAVRIKHVHLFVALKTVRHTKISMSMSLLSIL